MLTVSLDDFHPKGMAAIAKVAFAAGFEHAALLARFQELFDDVHTHQVAKNAFVRISVWFFTAILADHAPSSCSCGQFKVDPTKCKGDHETQGHERHGDAGETQDSHGEGGWKMSRMTKMVEEGRKWIWSQAVQVVLCVPNP